MKQKHGVLFILCFFFIFLPALSVHAEAIQGDINNNGVQDLTAIFKSEVLSKVELDRNEDGQIDAWFFFLVKAKDWDTRADYDENFDGKIDEVYLIKDDQPVRSLKDDDLDGLLDLEIFYAEGVPGANKKVDPPLDPAQISS